MPNTGTERRARLAAARLYLVCDSEPGGRTLAEVLHAAIAGGVDIVQLRDKRLSDDQLKTIARSAGALCRQLGTLFVVNDRPHVAIEAGADGVHVGQDDMPVAQVRELVGSEMLIGLSTHTQAEINAVRGLGSADPTYAARPVVGDTSIEVDYIGVGPIHSTPTKAGRPATGLDLVYHAANTATVPFFAIGGIAEDNAAAVVAAGARRVAVVRAIADAADPECAARSLRLALDRPADGSLPFHLRGNVTS